jgi:hypothetical protein
MHARHFLDMLNISTKHSVRIYFIFKIDTGTLFKQGLLSNILKLPLDTVNKTRNLEGREREFRRKLNKGH